LSLVISKSIINLEGEGPSIGICLFPSEPIIETYETAGQLPPQEYLLAVIDTGSSTSAFDVSYVDNLNLIPYDVAKVCTTAGPKEMELYDVIIEFEFKNPERNDKSEKLHFPVHAIGNDLSGQLCDAIIGRDILQFTDFRYFGSGNEKYEIEFFHEEFGDPTLKKPIPGRFRN